MAYIEVISQGDAEGELAEVYEHIVSTRGKLSEVMMIQSLNPASIRSHMDMYLTLMFGKGPMKREQRELVGVIVSMANECEYCTVHHMVALGHFWKDETRLQALRRDFRHAELAEVDMAIAEHAWRLTRQPGQVAPYHLQALRELGLSDRFLLDLNLIVSYFNFVNRMVLGLGVQLEDDPSGYKYD